MPSPHPIAYYSLCAGCGYLLFPDGSCPAGCPGNEPYLEVERASWPPTVHYAMAQALLARSARAWGEAGADANFEYATLLAAWAQVHATLACAVEAQSIAGAPDDNNPV